MESLKRPPASPSRERRSMDKMVLSVKSKQRKTGLSFDRSSIKSKTLSKNDTKTTDVKSQRDIITKPSRSSTTKSGVSKRQEGRDHSPRKQRNAESSREPPATNHDETKDVTTRQRSRSIKRTKSSSNSKHGNRSRSINRTKSGSGSEVKEGKKSKPPKARPRSPPTQRPQSPSTQRPQSPSTQRPQSPTQRRPQSPSTQRPRSPPTQRRPQSPTRRPQSPTVRSQSTDNNRRSQPPVKRPQSPTRNSQSFTRRPPSPVRRPQSPVESKRSFVKQKAVKPRKTLQDDEIEVITLDAKPGHYATAILSTRTDDSVTTDRKFSPSADPPAHKRLVKEPTRGVDVTVVVGVHEKALRKLRSNAKANSARERPNSPTRDNSAKINRNPTSPQANSASGNEAKKNGNQHKVKLSSSSSNKPKVSKSQDAKDGTQQQKKSGWGLLKPKFLSKSKKKAEKKSEKGKCKAITNNAPENPKKQEKKSPVKGRVSTAINNDDKKVKSSSHLARSEAEKSKTNATPVKPAKKNDNKPTTTTNQKPKQTAQLVTTDPKSNQTTQQDVDTNKTLANQSVKTRTSETQVSTLSVSPMSHTSSQSFEPIQPKTAFATASKVGLANLNHTTSNGNANTDNASKAAKSMVAVKEIVKKNDALDAELEQIFSFNSSCQCDVPNLRSNSSLGQKSATSSKASRGISKEKRRDTWRKAASREFEKEDYEFYKFGPFSLSQVESSEQVADEIRTSLSTEQEARSGFDRCSNCASFGFDDLNEITQSLSNVGGGGATGSSTNNNKVDQLARIHDNYNNDNNRDYRYEVLKNVFAVNEEEEHSVGTASESRGTHELTQTTASSYGNKTNFTCCDEEYTDFALDCLFGPQIDQHDYDRNSRPTSAETTALVRKRLLTSKVLQEMLANDMETLYTANSWTTEEETLDSSGYYSQYSAGTDRTDDDNKINNSDPDGVITAPSQQPKQPMIANKVHHEWQQEQEQQQQPAEPEKTLETQKKDYSEPRSELQLTDPTLDKKDDVVETDSEWDVYNLEDFDHDELEENISDLFPQDDPTNTLSKAIVKNPQSHDKVNEIQPVGKKSHNDNNDFMTAASEAAVDGGESSNDDSSFYSGASGGTPVSENDIDSYDLSSLSSSVSSYSSRS